MGMYSWDLFDALREFSFKKIMLKCNKGRRWARGGKGRWSQKSIKHEEHFMAQRTQRTVTEANPTIACKTGWKFTQDQRQICEQEKSGKWKTMEPREEKGQITYERKDVEEKSTEKKSILSNRAIESLFESMVLSRPLRTICNYYFFYGSGSCGVHLAKFQQWCHFCLRIEMLEYSCAEDLVLYHLL